MHWKSPEGFDEPDSAEMHQATHEEAKTLQVEATVKTPLCGGMGTTSNIVESKNQKDKLKRSHTKETPVKFANTSAVNLENESHCNLSFFGRMKPNVHSGDFSSVLT